MDYLSELSKGELSDESKIYGLTVCLF